MLRNTFFAQSQSAESKTITFRDNDKTEVEDLTMESVDISELPIDLLRTGNKLIARSPIAGGGIHDISVSITPNQLTINKNSWQDAPEEKEHFYIQECHWGNLSRTIDLPKPIDPDRTRASLNNGILTIIMPLASASHTKIIQIRDDSR